MLHYSHITFCAFGRKPDHVIYCIPSSAEYVPPLTFITIVVKWKVGTFFVHCNAIFFSFIQASNVKICKTYNHTQYRQAFYHCIWQSTMWQPLKDISVVSPDGVLFIKTTLSRIVNRRVRNKAQFYAFLVPKTPAAPKWPLVYPVGPGKQPAVSLG